MAELLSVQVHVPVTQTEDGKVLEKKSVLGFTRLKKAENSSQDQPKFNYLPRRKAVDVAFEGLTYSVSEGRQKGISLVCTCTYVCIIT